MDGLARAACPHGRQARSAGRMLAAVAVDTLSEPPSVADEDDIGAMADELEDMGLDTKSWASQIKKLKTQEALFKFFKANSEDLDEKAHVQLYTQLIKHSPRKWKESAGSDSRFRTVMSDTTTMVHGFSARSMAIILHKLAKLLHQDAWSLEELFNAIEEQGERLVAEGDARHVVMALRSYASTGYEGKSLFEAAEKQAGSIVGAATPDQIANLCWALAKKGNQCLPILREVIKQSEKLAAESTPQDLAKLTRSFATLKSSSTKLFGLVDQQADRILGGCSITDLATMLSAFGKLKIPAPNLLTAIENDSEQLVHDGSPKSISIIVGTYAALNHPSPRFFKAVRSDISRLVSTGRSIDLSVIGWAFETMGEDLPKLFEMPEYLAQTGVAGTPKPDDYADDADGTV